jgi:tight adherence protein C
LVLDEADDRVEQVSTVALVLATAIVVAPVLHRWRAARADTVRQAAVGAALPDTIELLVALIGAGLTPAQAARAMAERSPAATRPGWAVVVHRVDRGAPLADALGELAVVLGPSAAEMADALAAAERAGRPLGPTLARLSVEARAARRRQLEADARRLPVRLSFPLVVCTLPAFVLVTVVPIGLGTLSSLRDLH